MKTILAVLLMSASVLSFSAKASDSSDNLIEAAHSYLSEPNAYIQKG